MKDLQDKLQAIVEGHAKSCEETGSSHFNTCNAFSYGWDRDIWVHRHDIARALRERGYKVEYSTRWDVVEFSITKQLQLV